MTNTVLLRASAALFALSAATLATAPATARPMTAVDLATLNRLAAPTPSPDGQWVVYQLTQTAADSYARTTGLWLVNMANPVPVRIAEISGANQSSPAFSPDGRRLYFLSNKSGKDQLWMVDLAVGAGRMAASTPVQASDTLADVAGFRLSPTGGAVLMWGDIALNCPTFGCEGNANTALPGPGTGRVYDQMFVRHWDEWETPGIHSRAFTFPLGRDGKITGPATPIGQGLVGDTPSKPFGGPDELAWSADGRTVFFTLRVADANEPRSTNLDIYAAPATGGSATNLTDGNDATDTLPTPSPDGRTLAYVAMARPGYEADRQVLMLRDLRTGRTRALTQGWDRSVDSIAWAADSRSLIVTAQHILQHPAFRVDARTGRVEQLTDRGTVNDVSILRDGSIIYTINSITAPNDVVARNPAGQTRRLTDVNGERMAGLDNMAYETYNFAGANGDIVHGQILTPQGASGKLPTVLIVHGGPQGSLGNSWSNRWNPALWAAQGYAVVTVDFHGSTGYGQAFTDSINRDWGGKPLQDLQLGFAAAAATNAHVDTANACAAGASYGGYMMNWIAGNWADGFKCLIQHDGVFDARAMAYETEELWFDEWEHGGAYFDVPQEYERWNPVNHVSNWRTPMLVITGERDFRIPYTQGLASFTALQRRGIPSRLLVFPDENHWVLRGRNSVQWHQNVFGWLRQWTGNGVGNAVAAPPVSTPATGHGSAAQH
ncbi:MAG: prolyl oligopeptidase family serine peptidase [Sphingopyxis sp.]